MKVLDRYIFRTVLTSTLVALLVLVAIQNFLAFLAELGDLGKEAYNLLEAVKYVLLMTPKRVEELLPMAFLLGGLLGMGSLANGSELVIMRGAGISILRIVASTMIPGLLIGALGLALSEFISAPLAQKAELQRADAQGKGLELRGGDGFWARDKGQFIFIARVMPGEKLDDIRIYRISDQFRLESVSTAAEASYEDGTWKLRQVLVESIEPDRIDSEFIVEMPWDVNLDSDLLDVLAIDPEDLSIRELSGYIRYVEANDLDSRSHRLAFWQKVFWPLANLVMLLVAMPFVFGAVRSVTAGQRLFIGVLLGMVFFLSTRTTGTVALVYGLHPAVAAILPTLVFMAGGVTALVMKR
jgi:lipopolysaccharide export system permease protein